MAQLKDTTITGGLSVSGTTNITGATQHNADVTLYSSSGDSPSLIFQRGTYADNLNDYKITDVGGYLKIKQQGNSSTSGFTQVAELTNQGTFTVSTPPTTDTTPSVTAWISPTDSAIKISTDATIANGDKLVIRDSSDSNKLRSSSITFGTSTTTYLRNDGTWAEAGGGAAGTTLILNWTSGSGWYLATIAATTTPLTFNQILAYADAGPIFIRPITGTNDHHPGNLIAIPLIVSVDFIAADYDTTPVTVKLRLTREDGDSGQVYYEYLKLSANNETTAMYATSRNDTTPMMTVAQLTAGTDTYDRPVSAKVIHDYIASLDATNVAY